VCLMAQPFLRRREWAPFDMSEHILGACLAAPPAARMGRGRQLHGTSG
jgi:hypothetical protein